MPAGQGFQDLFRIHQSDGRTHFTAAQNLGLWRRGVRKQPRRLDRCSTLLHAAQAKMRRPPFEDREQENTKGSTASAWPVVAWSDRWLAGSAMRFGRRRSSVPAPSGSRRRYKRPLGKRHPGKKGGRNSKSRVQGKRFPLVGGPGAEGPRSPRIERIHKSGLGRFWVVLT